MKLPTPKMPTLKLPAAIATAVLTIGAASGVAHAEPISSVDGAFALGEHTYLFDDAELHRVSTGAEVIHDGWPVAITSALPGSFAENVDAAFTNPRNGRIHLFRGRRSLVFDPASNRVLGGGPIAYAYPGVWRNGIDAAVAVKKNGKAYLFKGDEYIRFDLARFRADRGYPKKISAGFPGAFASGIEGAAACGDGIIELFSGGQCIRFDLNRGCVAAGFPRAVSFAPAPKLVCSEGICVKPADEICNSPFCAAKRQKKAKKAQPICREGICTIPTHAHGKKKAKKAAPSCEAGICTRPEHGHAKKKPQQPRRRAPLAEASLRTLVKGFYESEGEWAGTYAIAQIEKVRTVKLGDDRIRVHVAYDYCAAPGSKRWAKRSNRRTGKDCRYFDLVCGRDGQWKVTRMGGYRSGTV